MLALDRQIVPAHVRDARRAGETRARARRRCPGPRRRRTHRSIRTALACRRKCRETVCLRPRSRARPGRARVRAAPPSSRRTHRRRAKSPRRRATTRSASPVKSNVDAAAFEGRDERADISAAVIQHREPFGFHRGIISRASGETPGMNVCCASRASRWLLARSRCRRAAALPAADRTARLHHRAHCDGRERRAKSRSHRTATCSSATSGQRGRASSPTRKATPRRPRCSCSSSDHPVAGVTIDGERMYLGAQFGVYELPYRTGDRTPRAPPRKIASVRTSGQCARPRDDHASRWRTDTSTRASARRATPAIPNSMRRARRSSSWTSTVAP